MKIQQINVYGDSIEECCSNPITGFYRDGFCRTDELDRGLHVVCAKMTEDFLSFSKGKGNDLSTPRPEFNFPGLSKRVILGVYVLKDGKRHTNAGLHLKYILEKPTKKP